MAILTALQQNVPGRIGMAVQPFRIVAFRTKNVGCKMAVVAIFRCNNAIMTSFTVRHKGDAFRCRIVCFLHTDMAGIAYVVFLFEVQGYFDRRYSPGNITVVAFPARVVCRQQAV